MLTNFQSKYKIQNKIGEGSFSEVLKCHDRETGTFLAAKRLKQSFSSAIEANELPELIAMRKISHHPNILQMIESYYDPVQAKVTIIFELMDMSIYDLMKSRKRYFPESRVKSYLYQLLKGVNHLHKHGIFHRDIKPENILIKGDVVKVADLGSIRGIYSPHPYTEYISTRWYRSPECLLTNGYYGYKMDVWALGCVFYELLTLKPLFPGSNELDQISRIHSIIGTPSTRFLTKLKKHKSDNIEYSFTSIAGTGFNVLLPYVSETGRDILKMMLFYDPDKRSNVRRLIEHRYFNEFRDLDVAQQRSSQMSITSAHSYDWRNPLLLSYMTSDKKRKPKRSSSVRHWNSPKTTFSTLSHNPRKVMKPSSLLPQKLGQGQKLSHQLRPTSNSNREEEDPIENPVAQTTSLTKMQSVDTESSQEKHVVRRPRLKRSIIPMPVMSKPADQSHSGSTSAATLKSKSFLPVINGSRQVVSKVPKSYATRLILRSNLATIKELPTPCNRAAGFEVSAIRNTLKKNV